MAKSVVVTKQTPTGKNTNFLDTKNGNKMTKTEFVRKIENGTYDKDYYVKDINGEKTPVSKPDHSSNNNLG